MIPTNRTNVLVTSNASGTTMQMGLDAEDIQHLLPILRDSLYSNKVLAPIREYSTNARDSHISQGTPDRPIQVTLPTKFEPELRVRDFGTSLTIDEVEKTYLRYCKSSKRFSNDFNGVYGLGCKSAFAYTEIFTIITYKDGLKTIINIPVSGTAQVIAQVPMSDTDEQGLEIVVPIAIKDVDAFHEEAMNFYSYWAIRPIIINKNPDLENRFFTPMSVKPIFSAEDWDVRPGGYDKKKSVAVMGFVPYPIDWPTVRKNMTPEQSDKYSKIFGFIENNLVTFVFSNGTADFTPSREALQYTELTVSTICLKLDKISDKIEEIISEKISAATNIWEAKCLYNKIFSGNSYDKNENTFYGNLNNIQIMMKDKLRWKGTVINDGKFENIDCWDKDTGFDKDYRYNSSGERNSVFSTITVDDSLKKTVSVSAKIGRYDRASVILASEKALILIIDQADSFKAAAGRYMFFDLYKDKGYTSIYCFDLSNPTVKDEFFKYYNFDSVPVVYSSKIETQVKAFLAANKVPRAESERVMAPYIDMEKYYEIALGKKDIYHVDFCWTEDGVSTKSVSGGVYLKALKNQIHYLDGVHQLIRRYSNNSSIKEILVNFAKLCLMTGKKVDRIYGIQPRTIESKWFNEEIEEGTWIELSVVAQQEFSKLDMNKTAAAMEYQTVRSSGHFIEIDTMKKLSNLIDDKNSVFHDVIKLIPDDIKSYNSATMIHHYLINKNNRTKEIKPQSVLADPIIQMKKQYPLIYQMNSENILFKDTSKADLTIYVDYINIMDLARNSKSVEAAA